MADLLGIKNYVMLFINDQADFMAEQANVMQIDDADAGSETCSETGAENGSEIVQLALKLVHKMALRLVQRLALKLV